jgi:TonB family protein
MPVNRQLQPASFGLLPEPERSTVSFVTSAVVNGLMLALLLYVGATARHVIQQRQFEQTILIIPDTKEPPPPPKVKLPEPPKIELPKPPDVKLEAAKIKVPRPEPKPDPKPILIESKIPAPVIKTAKPNIIEAPQPRAVLAAPMPAQVPQTKVFTAPVHFGQTFGVIPNPNAKGPATIAAIGNPYGGMNGAAIAPHGVVGGTGIGNGIKPIPNAGTNFKVASAGIPGSTTNLAGTTGKVASAGIPGMSTAVVTPKMTGIVASTNLEVISKPLVQYTAEAKQLKVQGDVVLRVTFTAAGQVVVQSVVHSLGHGLDEEARRVAQQIRFRPATRNGQAVDMTTNITISFQLA